MGSRERDGERPKMEQGAVDTGGLLLQPLVLVVLGQQQPWEGLLLQVDEGWGCGCLHAKVPVAASPSIDVDAKAVGDGRRTARARDGTPIKGVEFSEPPNNAISCGGADVLQLGHHW